MKIIFNGPHSSGVKKRCQEKNEIEIHFHGGLGTVNCRLRIGYFKNAWKEAAVVQAELDRWRAKRRL